MFVQHDASVQDGDQFGGAGWDCGGMAQDLLHAIQANTTYTLSVYGLSPTSKWKVAIETTGGSTLSTSAERVGSNWEQETIYYTAPSSGWPVGENLRVELIRVTPQVSTQTWFDKVELTTFAEPPPLPGQASIPNPSNGANDVNLTPGSQRDRPYPGGSLSSANQWQD